MNSYLYNTAKLTAVTALLSLSLRAQSESYLGNLAPIVGSIQRERGFPLSYENRKGSVNDWRNRGRAEVQRFLSFSPKTVPLDVKVESIAKRDGYEVRKISFAGSGHYRVPALLLVPDKRGEKLPAVVALHDHGGWFYHGKEKLVQLEGEHIALKNFRALLWQPHLRGRTRSPWIRGHRPGCLLLGRTAASTRAATA
jgi:hypothetical protein